MSTPTILPLAALPPWYNLTYTKEDGNLTDAANLHNDQTYQALNPVVNMFNYGIQIPNKTTTEITTFRDDNNVPLGTVWFNSTAGQLQFKQKFLPGVPPGTPPLGEIWQITSAFAF